MENKPFDYKKYFQECKFLDKSRMIVQIAILDILLVIICALGLLSVDYFIIGLLLLFLPAIFSSIFCLSLVQAKKDFTNKEFFLGIRNYYNARHPLYGSFDVIKGILYSVLVSLLTSFVFTWIYEYIGGEAFYEALNEMVELMYNGDTEAMMELISSNEALITYYNLSTIVSLSSATIFMIFRTGKFVFSVETRMLTSMLGTKRSTFLFKRIWKENRKEFSADFFKYTWYMSVSMLVVFIATLVVCIVTGYIGISYVLATTLCLMVGTAFFPRFLIFIEAITEKNLVKFKDSFKSMIDETMRRINAVSSLNEEEKKRLDLAMKIFDESSSDKDNQNDDDEEDISDSNKDNQ